jgi:hypothetical protein
MTFTVGTDRQYVVKNIWEFIINTDAKNRVTYGKGLTFTHSLSSFEPESRELVGFVNKWYYECRMSTQGGYRYYTGYGNDERRMNLSPDALEEFFTAFKGHTFNSSAGGNAPLLLSDAMPDIVINTEFTTDGELMLEYAGFSSVYIGRHVYILQELKDEKGKTYKRILLRCGTDRSSAISELMKAIVMNKGVLTFAEEDIPSFCSSILPK